MRTETTIEDIDLRNFSSRDVSRTRVAAATKPGHPLHTPAGSTIACIAVLRVEFSQILSTPDHTCAEANLE
jgi:hypothetical protein